MGNLADYFERVAYKPTWIIGDRVIGKWNNIPFVGTVGNDQGPDMISVHLDLPIKFGEMIYNIVFAKHKDIRKLQEIKE